MERTSRPASKISSLIQEAESKAAKKKSSIENLNLMKRESPLGGEDNSSKSDDLSNAPKLPPKPGKNQKEMVWAWQEFFPRVKCFNFSVIFCLNVY